MRSGGISAIEKKPRKGPSVDREVTRKPMLTIEGGRRWASLDLRNLWLHQDLFFFSLARSEDSLQANRARRRMGDAPAAAHDGGVHAVLR